MKNSEVLAFGFILMQGEIKTFQHVLKARESTKETDDRHVTGAKYIPVMVNPHFRHCFKYESSDSDLDVPCARLISLLPQVKPFLLILSELPF